MIEGTLTTQFAYNGDGVRTSKAVDGAMTNYVVDLAATLPVVISDTDAIYLYGLDIIAEQQAERHYYVHDGLGSARQLLDNTGQIATSYAYDPFGVPLAGGGVANPWRFTGEAWDAEVELLYLRARYYQPATGRLITKDPWPGDVLRPGTLNGYVYVASNPVNRADPMGQQCVGPGCLQPTPAPIMLPQQEPVSLPTPPAISPTDIVQQTGDCQIRTIPRTAIPTATAPPIPETRLTAWGNKGRILLHQHTFVSGEHVRMFRMVYASLAPPAFGYVDGAVRSNLEVIASTYANGVYLDIFDTYDTSDLRPFETALAFVPKLYRTVEVQTAFGVQWGPCFPPICKEPDFPYTVTKKQDFPKGIPVGETGRGHLHPGMWFSRFEGWPYRLEMHLVVSGIAGRGLASPTNSYQMILPYSITDYGGWRFARETPVRPE